MLFKVFVAASLIAIAAPASAATFVLGGSSADSATKTFIAGGETLTAYGFTYAGTPGSVNLSTSFAAAPIRQSSAGLGVCQSGEAGDQCTQVDSNGVNEALAFSSSTGAFTIGSAVFSIIDSNDTLKAVGFDGTNLVNLGFGGTFASGLTGAGIASTTAIGGNTYRVDFSGLGNFQYIAFLQQNDSDDGFRVNSVTTGAVPEPATWAMMITGFGFVGGAMRRRAVKVNFATA